MQRLVRPSEVVLSLLAVMLVAAYAATKADARTLGPPSDVVKPIPGVSAYAGLSDGFKTDDDARRNEILRDITPGSVVSAQLANGLSLAPHAPLRGARGKTLIGTDPFGLWTVTGKETPKIASSVATKADTTKTWPVVLSAVALLVTTVFGWRLIRPAHMRSPKRRRRDKVFASPVTHSDETETSADVARYIMGTITPRSLTRRKKRRRKASSRSGEPDSSADVARAVADIVLPRTRRKTRRRSSRQSTGIPRS